ncbi:hypothetical protein KTO58_19995 [Chitinophaga pendula]|uniref:hypothetical protein n=1 Tax=Chitinophaga TaxID=79328 RepID=UPI000BAEB75D|nr:MULTISPECIES: hypothetical protein [Chitinophaga]ASZ11051.1 hypothetical protein CK934_08800 [Chitinophaga sp. MD30]UCJ05952.1 hypothetical protein KTO58_19995 [Chitinophaga pendula]
MVVRKLRRTGVCLFLLLWMWMKADAQQLKLGDNPAVISKTALLELSSSNQGLLLPRLTDTAAINALLPATPTGMMIFLTSDNSLRIRKGGVWARLAETSSLPSSYIQSLNGLTTAAQAFAVSNNTASAIGFSSAGSTHTLNIPDAAATARGVVSTTAQTFTGDKTFSGNVSVTGNETVGGTLAVTGNTTMSANAVVNGTTQIGSTGTALTAVNRATVNYDVPVITGNGSLRVAFTVPSAVVGASVIVTPSQSLPDNCVIAYSYVKSAGVVEVMFVNQNQTTYAFNGVTLLGIPLLGSVTTNPAAGIDPPAMNYYFTLIR